VQEAAVNIVVGLVIATVSSLITVQLSFRRFRLERLWDRKAMAYERVIEALQHSKAFSNAHITASIFRTELSEEKDQDLRQRAKHARLEIERATDMGSFLLSDRAKERLLRYAREVQAAADTHDWFEYLTADLAATKSCLSDLIKIAKGELRT